MRYRYLDNFRRGISVFVIFSYGIALLVTPQCPPPDREYARRSSQARSTRGQENEAWALYKKFHPGSPEVTFLGSCSP